MPSLFDTLGTPTSAQSLAPPTDTAEKLQKITDVGATGAVATTPATKRSALGEAGALDEVKAGLQQLDQQQTQVMQGQQLQAHQLDTETMIQNKQLDQAVLTMRTNRLSDATKILGDMERGTKQLNAEKAAAQFEQLGINLRLSNDRYMFNLQDEGNRARLANKNAFDEQLQATVFGDTYWIARHNAAAAIDLNAEKQEWLQSIGMIDIEAALAFSGTSAGEYRTAALAGGVTQGIGAAATAYGRVGVTSRTDVKAGSGNREAGVAPEPVTNLSPIKEPGATA